MLAMMTMYLVAWNLFAFAALPRNRGPAEVIDLAEHRARRRRKEARANRALVRMRRAVRAKRTLAGLQ
jgi:hypothetical protein